MPKKEVFTTVNGQRLKLTNLQKVLYPNAEHVKAEVIEYYLSVSQFMIPHIINRPLTLIRFPDGITKKSFYTKNAPAHTPAWITTFDVSTESSSNAHIMVQDNATLVWLANLAALEIHPFLSQSSTIENPDHFIFDLDPTDYSAFDQCKEVAFQIGNFLSEHGYHPFLKTSGSKGLHVYVPIAPIYSFKTVKDLCRSLALKFIKEINPDCTIHIHKEKRKGKLLLDIYRNHKGNSCVAPYSLRGHPHAPVSTPLAWSELDSLDSSQQYNLSNIQVRLSKVKNVWSEWSNAATDLLEPKRRRSISESSIGREPSPKPNAPVYRHMLAETSQTIPVGHYTYEIKWDGIRAFFIISERGNRIFSRNGNDISSQFPLLIDAMNDLKSQNAVFDGEIVCLDAQGKPVFPDVISRLHTKGKVAIDQLSKTKRAHAYLFDLIYLDGEDITSRTIELRRSLLNGQLAQPNPFRLSEVLDQGLPLFKAVAEAQMEGVMAKKIGSPYHAGMRSRNWLKIKVRKIGICTIIGYTQGKGDRRDLFGALHLAEKENDQFIYRGKVGTGFGHEQMNLMLKKLRKLEILSKYISNAVEDERNSIWIKPILQCKVQYASMTNNQTYREPVFIKLIN